MIRGGAYELPAPAPDGATLSLRALLTALRRRWFIAGVLGLLCGGGAAAAAYVFVPAPYSAFAELEISTVPQFLLFPTAEQRAVFDVYKSTQMRKVKGPTVLTGAIRAPEVAGLPTIRDQQRPVNWLEKELQVTSVGSEFVRISLSGDRPGELAAIVNAVTNRYLDDAARDELHGRRGRLKDLEDRQKQKEQELRDQRDSLKKLVDQLQAANPTQGDAKKQFLYELQIQMRKEAANVYFDLMRKKLLLDARQQNADSEPQVEIPPEVLDQYLSDNPEYGQISARVAQLETLVAQFKARAPDNHPRAKAAREELAREKARLAALEKSLRPEIARRLAAAAGDESAVSDAQLKRDITVLEAEYEKLNSELKDVVSKADRTGTMTFELETLGKDIERSETIYRTISDQIEKIETELESPVGIKLYREAEVPFQRDTKKKYMATTVAGLGGFGLIVFGIVWLEHLSRRVSSMDEVSEQLSIRVMGSVPVMPRWVTNGKSGRPSAKATFWHSVLTESIDSTRTMLLREAKLESMNTVMVASAMGGEGKTTLSCHLATSLARAGRRVVLIDCDMRRPSVHRVFDMPLSPGLCEVLRGELPLDNVIYPAAQENLSVVPAGRINQDVLQILAQDGVGAVIEQLKQEFDFVLVDSSPVLPVADSLLIAQHVDGVIFSIRRDVSRVAKVAAACHRMAMLGVPVLGAVVIGLDEGSYGYRYPDRYGYGYRNGYAGQPVAQ